MKRLKQSLPDAAARKSSERLRNHAESVLQVCIIRRQNVKIVSGSIIKNLDTHIFWIFSWHFPRVIH
jgi:hypothetical protein